MLNPTQYADEMLTAYQNAGKLVGMDTASKNQLKADWEFQANLLFEHFKNNAVVKTEVDTGNDANTRFNANMTAGVPIPQDGGIGLQTTTLTQSSTPSTETQTGGIE